MKLNWFISNFLGLQEQYRERDKITNELKDRIKAAKEIGDKILRFVPFMLFCTLVLGLVFIGTISEPSQNLSMITMTTIFLTGICFLFFILVAVTGISDIIKSYKIMSTLSRKLFPGPRPT